MMIKDFFFKCVINDIRIFFTILLYSIQNLSYLAKTEVFINSDSAKENTYELPGKKQRYYYFLTTFLQAFQHFRCIR